MSSATAPMRPGSRRWRGRLPLPTGCAGSVSTRTRTCPGAWPTRIPRAPIGHVG
jgi:hypothetical protein